MKFVEANSRNVRYAVQVSEVQRVFRPDNTVILLAPPLCGLGVKDFNAWLPKLYAGKNQVDGDCDFA
jgi:hypothetical protein